MYFRFLTLSERSEHSTRSYDRETKTFTSFLPHLLVILCHFGPFWDRFLALLTMLSSFIEFSKIVGPKKIFNKKSRNTFKLMGKLSRTVQNTPEAHNIDLTFFCSVCTDLVYTFMERETSWLGERSV